MLDGKFESLKPISIELRTVIHEIARKYTKIAEAIDATATKKKKKQIAKDLTKPGDDYSARGDHSELLSRHGWTLATSNNGTENWSRPGKDPKDGHSATWGHVAPRKFFVFTSSTELESDRAYDLFGLFARLEHDGDLKKAAKALKAQGFGAPPAKGTPILLDDNLDLDRYYQGVYECDDHYKVSVTRNKTEQLLRVSSFKLKPTARIVQDNGITDELCDIISDSGVTTENVLFRREDLTDAKMFRKVLPSTEYAYWGNTEVLQKIGKLLRKHEVPTKAGTDKIGKHESGVWICPNSALITAKKGLVANDIDSDAEVIYLPRSGQSEMNSQLEYCTSRSDIAPRVRSLIADLFQLNDENVMTLIVSWLFATPFTTEIKELLSGFPTLTVTGTRGTGKSTLFELLSGLVGYSGQLFGCGQSKFVLTKLISSTTSVPIIFDEYKNDLREDVKTLFGRYVRRSYKGEKDYRGNANQTLTEYSLTAPLAILGEIDFSGESALLDRSIRINFSPRDLNSNAHEAYKKIRRINLNEIGTEYIRFCLSQDRKAIEKAINELPEMPEDLSFRMSDNFRAVAFGWTMFNRFIKKYTTVNPERQEMQLNNALQHLYNETCEVAGGTKLAVDKYIEQLAVMAETGRLHRGIHFDFIDDEDRNEIYLRNDACYAEYVKFARELREPTLTLPAYRRQLRENFERGSYITDPSKIIRLSDVLPTVSGKRVVVIDKQKAIDYGIEDLDGFDREPPAWLEMGV